MGHTTETVKVLHGAVSANTEVEVAVGAGVGRSGVHRVTDDDGRVVAVLEGDADTVRVGLLGVAVRVVVLVESTADTVREVLVNSDDSGTVGVLGRSGDDRGDQGGGEGGEDLELHCCGLKVLDLKVEELVTFVFETGCFIDDEQMYNLKQEFSVYIDILFVP